MWCDVCVCVCVCVSVRARHSVRGLLELGLLSISTLVGSMCPQMDWSEVEKVSETRYQIERLRKQNKEQTKISRVTYKRYFQHVNFTSIPTFPSCIRLKIRI